jgi:hypothetical protein
MGRHDGGSGGLLPGAGCLEEVAEVGCRINRSCSAGFRRPPGWPGASCGPAPGIPGPGGQPCRGGIAKRRADRGGLDLLGGGLWRDLQERVGIHPAEIRRQILGPRTARPPRPWSASLPTEDVPGGLPALPGDQNPGQHTQYKQVIQPPHPGQEVGDGIHRADEVNEREQDRVEALQEQHAGSPPFPLLVAYFGLPLKGRPMSLKILPSSSPGLPRPSRH